jgi:hypothetical protein
MLGGGRGGWGQEEGVVEGALDGEAASVQDVGVDHGGADVAVAEELLDGADVVAAFEEMGGEGVAKGVAGGWLGDTCNLGRVVPLYLMGEIFSSTSCSGFTGLGAPVMRSVPF